MTTKTSDNEIDKEIDKLSLNNNEQFNQSEEFERKLTIIYSTETGNSQDVAERLGRESTRWRWETEVMDVIDFDPVSFSFEIK